MTLDAPAAPLFETERLRVRPWTLGEADMTAALRMYGDPEVTRYIGGKVFSDAAAIRAHMTMRLEQQAAWQGRYGGWPVETTSDSEVVGAVLMKPLPDAHDQSTEDIEIGWHLARTFWGLGYATEVARGMVEHARRLGIAKLHVVVEPPNERSLAVARRLGCQHQGQTRKYYSGNLLELFTLDL